MRYWGPINSPGGIYGNDGYADGNLATGAQGSIPTFRTFEQMMRELQNLVTKSELTPDDIMNGIQVAQATQSQRINYAPDTGTADGLIVNANPIPASLSPGLICRCKKIAAANNTTTPTLNMSGLGARVITYPSGSPIGIGDLQASALLEFMYDAITSKWCLISNNFGAGALPDFAPANFATNWVLLTSPVQPSVGSWPIPSGVKYLMQIVIVAGGGGGAGSVAGGAGAGGHGGYTVQGSLNVGPGTSWPSPITYV